MGRHLLYPGNIPAGNLQGTLAATGAASFTVSGWTTAIGGSGKPFVAVVDPGQSNEEKILCDSCTTAGVVTIDTRGWDSTTALEHNPGAVVKIVWDATSAQDHSDHIYDTSRDDHGQYLTTGRHDVTARHGATVVLHGNIGGLGNDDHTQYLTVTRHDAHMHPASCLPTGSSAAVSRANIAGAAQGMPVGSLVEIPGGITADEANYLLPADGSNVSRTTWPALFNRYGTKYGAGDGSTTFGLPDVRSRMRIGASSAAIGDGVRTNRSEGATGGEEAHLLVLNELPSHGHNGSDLGHNHGVSDPGHTHASVQASGVSDGWIAARNSGSGNATQAGGNGDKINPISPGSVGTGASTTGISTGTGYAGVQITPVGGGQKHNNLGPWIAVPVYVVAA